MKRGYFSGRFPVNSKWENDQGKDFVSCFVCEWARSVIRTCSVHLSIHLTGCLTGCMSGH